MAQWPIKMRHFAACIESSRNQLGRYMCLAGVKKEACPVSIMEKKKKKLRILCVPSTTTARSIAKPPMLFARCSRPVPLGNPERGEPGGPGGESPNRSYPPRWKIRDTAVKRRGSLSTGAPAVEFRFLPPANSWRELSFVAS